MAARSYQRSHLSPEQIILLAASRSELTPDHEQRIHRATRHGVDWDAVWGLAHAHGVGYFVGRHLLDAGQSVVSGEWCQAATTHHSPLTKVGGRGEQLFLPPTFVQRVKDDLRRETARALVLAEYQLRLNEAFERSHLPVLWLKGLLLAQRLYGRFEARQCGDLDILVAPAQIPGAKATLARLGFEPYHPPFSGQEFHPLGAHHSLWSLRLGNDWHLIVELHHRLSGPCPCQPAVEQLFERSRMVVALQGQTSRVPSLEDELLILSLHAHHHNYSLLRCLMDMAEYLKSYRRQLNWPKLVDQARGCHSLGRVRAALEITHAVLGLDSAQDVFSQVSAMTPRQSWACRRLPINALLNPATQNNDGRQFQLALLLDRWSDVFRLFVARILPAKEHVRTICPTFLAPYPPLPRMYYFLHAAKQMLGGHRQNPVRTGG